MQQVLALFDPFALGLVWLGSFVVVSLQEGFYGLGKTLQSLLVLSRANPVSDAQVARQVLCKAENIIDLKGLQCIDRIKTDECFVTLAIHQLSLDQNIRHFSLWASAALDDREARHNIVIRFWVAVADIAPAIGMIGTIIGMIGMFDNITDPSELGKAMALALLTTFYGLILANVIAAPIAQRLLRFSSEELKWQRMLTDRLMALASRNDRRE